MDRSTFLRIALLGTRGVPASYSGFETCAEELGTRLAARGHQVTVYCRVPHIRACERGAARFPDRVVTDSRGVQQHYRQHRGTASTYIAYGADPIAVAPGAHLARFGLAPRRYVLFVGRLVPENCAHHLVEA